MSVSMSLVLVVLIPLHNQKPEPQLVLDLHPTLVQLEFNKLLEPLVFNKLLELLELNQPQELLDNSQKLELLAFKFNKTLELLEFNNNLLLELLEFNKIKEQLECKPQQEPLPTNPE